MSTPIKPYDAVLELHTALAPWLQGRIRSPRATAVGRAYRVAVDVLNAIVQGRQEVEPEEGLLLALERCRLAGVRPDRVVAAATRYAYHRDVPLARVDLESQPEHDEEVIAR